MKELKETALCVAPFIVSALMVYPFMAIVGADLDPFMWSRDDRIFYGVCSGLYGWALFTRINLARGEKL